MNFTFAIISHCILNSIEGDICPMQDLKIQIILSWDGYFPQILIKQNTLDLLPCLKLQIKWLRNWPWYKSIYHISRWCYWWEWIINLEYVMNFRVLWTLMAFTSQTQQQHCFQSSLDSCIVNCALYIKLDVKGIRALGKVYIKLSQCQAEMPHN